MGNRSRLRFGCMRKGKARHRTAARSGGDERGPSEANPAAAACAQRQLAVWRRHEGGAPADLPGLQQVTNSVTAPTVQVVNRCWQEAIPSEGVGTFAINGMTLIASTYYEGVKLPALFACLQAGGVAAQLDADQQYMQYTVEVVPGTANTSALLVVGDGVYMEIQLALGALLGRGSAPAAQPSDRKLLEATQADLARHSEQSAVAMLPMVEKLTARDDIWVVGSAAGTLLETQLGEVQMTFRVDDGVALQGALEMKDAAKAKEMVEKLEATKQQIESAPLDSAVKALVNFGNRHPGLPLLLRRSLR